jgi:hypothetical protein
LHHHLLFFAFPHANSIGASYKSYLECDDHHSHNIRHHIGSLPDV